MGKIQNFLHRYIFWIILLASIPAVWALFVHGYYGASDDIHIAWLYEMDASLRAMQIPPRFVPDLSFAFGYPLFNFVFPLPYYIGEIFHVFRLSFVDSVKAVFAISIPISMYFMYLFLKEFSDEILALSGAVLYVFTPYRATDIFVRGAMGEILAFVFPPLIGLSIIKLTNEKKIEKKWIGILALATAGLVMSHNIMAYMFIPFLFLLFIIRIVFSEKNRITLLIKTSIGFVLGLLVSLYFWFPAIVESTYMKYDTVFNYWDQFPSLKQLLSPYFGYGGANPGQNLVGMSFFVGLLNLILIPLGFFYLIFYWKKLEKKVKIVLIWALSTFFFALFMMNYRSIFVWRIVPFLPYFQFPWRFLSLTTFATPILVIIFSKFKFGKIIGLAILVLAILLNYKDFRPQDFLGRTDAYFINRYIPVPAASSDYLKTQEEYLRLPKATEKRPDKNYPRISAVNGQVQNINYINSIDAAFDVASTNGAEVDYNKYLFPGWQATVDSKKVELKAGKPFGQITFSVPAGMHSVKVWLTETPFRLTSDIISLISFIAVITIVVIPKFRENEK